MAKGVIDELELVDVDVDHRQVGLATDGCIELANDGAQHGPLVVKLGEGIALRMGTQDLGLLLQLAGIGFHPFLGILDGAEQGADIGIKHQRRVEADELVEGAQHLWQLCLIGHVGDQHVFHQIFESAAGGEVELGFHTDCAPGRCAVGC